MTKRKKTTPTTRPEWRDLLLSRITESGLSVEDFSDGVLLREARTVRRWLDLSSPIPKRVQKWILDPKPMPWPWPEQEVIDELREEMQEAGICSVCGTTHEREA